MNIWIVSYLALNVLGLGVTLARHGEPQGNHNAFLSLFAWGVSLTLLYMGGAFTH